MGIKFNCERCEKLGNGNTYRFKIGKNIKDEKIIPGLNERTQLHISATAKNNKKTNITLFIILQNKGLLKIIEDMSIHENYILKTMKKLMIL